MQARKEKGCSDEKKYENFLVVSLFSLYLHPFSEAAAEFEIRIAASGLHIEMKEIRKRIKKDRDKNSPAAFAAGVFLMCRVRSYAYAPCNAGSITITTAF